MYVCMWVLKYIVEQVYCHINVQQYLHLLQSGSGRQHKKLPGVIVRGRSYYKQEQVMSTHIHTSYTNTSYIHTYIQNSFILSNLLVHYMHTYYIHTCTYMYIHADIHTYSTYIHTGDDLTYEVSVFALWQRRLVRARNATVSLDIPIQYVCMYVCMYV